MAQLSASQQEAVVLKLRLIYLTLIPIIIASAFATRCGATWIPGFVAEYGGDTLWALMVFMVFRIIVPRWPLLRCALITLAISYLVETSQLYHAPSMNKIRSYRLGVILLGDTFVWSDLVCYTVGILAGALAEGAMRKFVGRERVRHPRNAAFLNCTRATH